jgi:peptidoglycan hydrolase-like protein with peptidoglycan-binding domain
MARCPLTTWHQLGDNPTHQPLMSKYDGIVLHTAVGSLITTFGYFAHANGEGYVGTESHFIVGGYGEGWQITDTARTADANLDGNSRLLSIETADTYPPFGQWSGSDVPAWTDEQIATLARIVAWAAHEHGFPLVRMKDSKPTTRGVGYHRLGIDPWRVDGGEHWSSSGGKVCPGDRRIAQVDEVIRRAQALSSPPWPEFRTTSPAVGAMVKKLEANGYFIDGHRDRTNYYGAWTRGAIRRLQEDFDDTKADPDGLLGPLTWAHIEALPDAPPPPPPPHEKPLAEAWQRTQGDVARAEDARNAAAAAFVKAHPNMKAYAALANAQAAHRPVTAAEWQAIKKLNPNP